MTDLVEKMREAWLEHASTYEALDVSIAAALAVAKPEIERGVLRALCQWMRVRHKPEVAWVVEAYAQDSGIDLEVRHD